MPRVIISGAPGVGKTTLLVELGLLGYSTVSESAREIIAERVKGGLNPRPDPKVFAREIYLRDKGKYDASPIESQPVFFDRCAIESLGMVHEASPLTDTELEAELSSFTFHRTVFLLPPWQQIYQTDSERDHTFSHAVRVHHSLLGWYNRCGYFVHEVPRVGVSERAKHVLHLLCDAYPNERLKSEAPGARSAELGASLGEHGQASCRG